MTDKFQVLVAPILVVLALSALNASLAQAAQFTANAYPTTVTAASPLGNGEIVSEAGTLECAEHYVGTLSGASSSITLTPTFTNCTAYGFSEAAVDVNGCEFVVHVTGGVDLNCPSGKVLEFTAHCVWHIPAQTGLKWVTLTNQGSHVNMSLNLSNLTYNATKDPFLCPLSGTGHKTGLRFRHSLPLTLKPIKGGSSFTLVP